MEFFVDLIGFVLPYIKTAFLAIIPLGFIIFIHELGHFFAAKRCGIKVNTFSIGFGWKLWGFQWGETEYRISLLPFGGYVKMEGEDPNEQTGEPGEFASASIGNRALVVAAGPAVNLVFGVLVYWLVFMTGLNSDSARLIGGLTGLPLGEPAPIQSGWVAEGGPGAVGGLQSGDTVLAVNGDPINHWAMFQTRIFTSANKPLDLLIEREGEQQTLTVVPDAEESVRGDIGIIRVSSRSETSISHIAEDSPAALAGLQVGDDLQSINGTQLHNVPYFGYGVWHANADWRNRKYQALYENINASRDSLTLSVRRGAESFTTELPVNWQLKANVQPDTDAHAAGIQNGDILLTLNGAPVDNATLYGELQQLGTEPIALGVLRDGTEQTLTLVPSETSDAAETGTNVARFGLAWQTALSGMEFTAKTPPLPTYTLITGLEKGVEATWLTFTTVGRTLRQLVGGEVSPRHLSGPIGIANVTSRMFERVGFGSVLFFIGFISINLCIVNLLPIPIADGGLLLFFAVEKIRGRPMPIKAQAIVQQVSIVLLIALFLYITWFDGLSLIDDLRN